MLLRMHNHFKGSKLARMSSGTYCIIRDLGPVKGGKGMRHHEVLMIFSLKALWAMWSTSRIDQRQSSDGAVAGTTHLTIR